MGRLGKMVSNAVRARGRGRDVILLLGLIMGLAIIVRAVALGYGLPFIYHPDEPRYVDIIQSIYHGDLNPHFFNYPTLFFYLNALIYVPVFGVLNLFGSPVNVLPVISVVMGATLAQTPQAVLLSRWISLLFGAGSLFWLFFLGRSITRNSWPGLLAALLLAISPTAIKINRFITPDTFVVFFILATIFFSLRVERMGRNRDYLMAGVCAGLAASSKYNAGLVVLVPILAHFLREGWKGWRQAAIYRSLALCGVAFLITSPFVLYDFQTFWGDFRYEAQHYSSIGHPGMEGNSLTWYLAYLWMVEGVSVVWGALVLIFGLVWNLFRRSTGRKIPTEQASTLSSGPESSSAQWKDWLVVFVFPIVYFVFISGFIVRNDRTLLPVIPFLLLAAGIGIDLLFQQANSAARAGGVLVLGLSLAMPLITLVHYAQAINQPAPIEQARVWVNANLPSGTRIVVESYAPYLDQQRYRLTPIFRAILKDSSWYRDEDIDYLILAGAMYGRYYCDPGRYSVEMGQYDRLFRAFDPVATFENPVKTGPFDPLLRAVGVKTICIPHADLLDTHGVVILKVR